ncbi:MAG TPA: GNAT family N-acetyltransferase [Caulobacteraceae bacterium]|jgi:hypothetical protein|nr:GNAT family N-acetyltransferase [Caulobacteraceae bacterium]
MLDEAPAGRLIALAAEESPFGPGPPPDDFVARCLAWLGAAAAGASVVTEQARLVPQGLSPDPRADIVASGSAAGAHLIARLRREGMAPGLKSMGFVDEREFWEPWCAALIDGNPVSICFAARRTPTGACAGVATAAAFRGRGLASAVVAAWSRHPSLDGKTLFYSHAVTNLASSALADGLGLGLFAGVVEFSLSRAA